MKNAAKKPLNENVSVYALLDKKGFESVYFTVNWTAPKVLSALCLASPLNLT